MASPSLVAAFLVLLPGMLSVGYVLRRYEGYFEQARLFFAIFAALFAGIVVKALEVYLFPFDDISRLYAGQASYSQGQLVYAFAYTCAGFALLAAAATTVVLGLRKFRGRKDTPYYGVAFGLVFGAMWCVFFVALGLQRLGLVQPALRWDGIALMHYVGYLLFALGVTLAHGAAGAWVAKGVAQGSLWRGMMVGTLWLIPIMGLHWLFATFQALIVTVAMGLAGAVLIGLAMRKVLDPIVPAHIRDEMRKQRRRAERKA